MKARLQYIYTFLFALFCASVPFTDTSKAIPNILMGVLAGLFFFVVKKEDFQRLKTKSFYLLGFMTLFGALCVIIFQRWFDWSFISRLMTIMGIIIISIPIKNYIIPIKAFVISAFSLLVISSANLIAYVNDSDSFDFTSGEHINTLLLGERPYLGIFYVASASLCWFLANRTSRILRFLWYFISLCFIAFVVVISARMALISLFLLLFWTILYYRKKLKTILIPIAGVLIVLLILIASNDNVKNRFFFRANKEFVLNERLVHEPRYHIWECALGLKHNTSSFFFGKGFEQMEKELVGCYESRQKFNSEDQQQWFVEKKFNTHNQYLGVYYCMGAVAFVLFIGFLAFALAESRKSYYASVLTLLLILFLVTENLLHRQIGITYMALTIVFSRFLYSNKL
jgi:O-antigen ligase